jgi:hypothetical protein
VTKIGRGRRVLRQLWRRRDSWVVVLLIGLSLSLNAYLLGSLGRSPKTRSREQFLVAGSRVPNLTAEEPGGGKVRIDWAAQDKPVVIYILAPGCRWCARNLQNIKTLSAVKKKEFRFIGISILNERIDSYLKEINLSFPVYINPQLQDGRRFAVSSTPTTAIISPGGSVKNVWHGAYSGAIKDEIEGTLSVSLPGLLATGQELHK